MICDYKERLFMQLVPSLFQRVDTCQTISFRGTSLSSAFFSRRLVSDTGFHRFFWNIWSNFLPRPYVLALDIIFLGLPQNRAANMARLLRLCFSYCQTLFSRFSQRWLQSETGNRFLCLFYFLTKFLWVSHTFWRLSLQSDPGMLRESSQDPKGTRTHL